MMEQITSFVDRNGGLVVVVAGLIVVLIAYLFSVNKFPETDAATALASFGGVVGTIVGAFFGIKAGAASGEKAMEKADEQRKQTEQQRQKAEQLRDKTQAKLDLLLGHTPSDRFDFIRRERPDLFGPPQSS